MFNSLFRKNPVTHIIGRVVHVFNDMWRIRHRTQKSIDESIPDYSYWDRFRWCLIDGYELAGLFAQTINETVAAWVIGRAVSVRLAAVDDARFKQKVEYTNDMLRRFFLSIQGDLGTLYEDVLALGDQFVFVNPDGSLRIVSPDLVDIEYEKLDPLEPTAYHITTVLDGVTIVDTYTKTQRIVETYEGAPPDFRRLTDRISTAKTVQVYPILINRFPIVHFANTRGKNEQRGHPLIEVIRPLLSEYNDLLRKGLQGAKVAGNPIPVFENLFDPEDTIERMATEEDDTYLDKDGNEETRKLIRWDEQGAIVLGEGGRFKFAAPPPGFSRDILAMLKHLFDVLIYRLHTPEQMWGVGLQIGKGVEEQTPMWVRFIEGRRDKFAGTSTDKALGIKARGGLHELAEIWLQTKALTDSKIYVGATVIRWSDLTEKDRSLTFEWVKYLQSRGFITGRTALEKSGLVEDVDTEYQLAQSEFELNAQKQQQQFDDFTGLTPGASGDKIAADGTTDLRKNNGASAPRMPAFAGGGAVKKGK